MSKLLEKSEEYRKNQKSKNIYGGENPYNRNHSRALSDGDKWGRGRDGGTVGTSVDESTKRSLLSKNKYSRNKPYNENSA